MQRVYRVRELIVADPLARVALVSVQTDLLRVHNLIKRHRAICARCKLNQPLREDPSHKTLPSPKVVPIKRASLSHAALPSAKKDLGGSSWSSLVRPNYLEQITDNETNSKTQ